MLLRLESCMPSASVTARGYSPTDRAYATAALEPPPPPRSVSNEGFEGTICRPLFGGKCRGPIVVYTPLCPVLLKDAAAERRPTASVATSPTSIHSAGGEAFPGRKEPMRTFTCEWSATVGDEYELVSKLGDDLSCSRAASRSLAQRHARLLVRAPRLCACRHPQPLCVLICVRVCPHQFCKACMTQAVARNPRCPICRRSVEFLRVDVRVTGGVARDRGCIPVGDCARRELERRRGEPGAVIADGDIAASAGGGVGAAEAAAADEEMAAAAAAAYAAEEQEQQDEEEQVSLAGCERVRS